MSESKEPLTDPATGKPLPQRVQPGYYPGWDVLRERSYWDAATRTVVEQRLEPPAALRFFTPEEASTLTAVMDRILPQEDRKPEFRIPLLPDLDRRLSHNRIEGFRYEDMPPDQEAYRIGIQALEAMAHEQHGRSFAELDVCPQEELLRSLADGKPAGAPGSQSQQLWSRMNLKRFWSLLVSDACSAYYAHPWSWNEIGYGGPAYPRGYMRLENGRPEPWEFNEHRYEWAAPADTLSDKVQTPAKDDQSYHGQSGTH